jgi:hypothetical protein
MDDSPHRIGALGTTVTWDIAEDDAVGEPFAGASILVDWTQQDLIDAAHYLLRIDGRAAIGRYDQDTHTMSVAVASAPLGPPFDLIGRIVRLVRRL